MKSTRKAAPRPPAPLVIVCEDLHNLGDLAILLQNLEVERQKRPAIHVRQWSVPSGEIVNTVARAGGRIFSGRSITELFRLLGGVDLSIGGGQLVRDNASPASLLMLFLSVCLVRLGGGQVETRGLGASELNSRLHRFLWRRILRLAHHVRVRDEVSSRNMRLLTGTGKAEVTADMVFLPGQVNAMFSGIRPDKDGDRILIVQCIDPSEGRSIELDALPTLLDMLSSELPHASVEVVPHDYRPHMDVGTKAYMSERYEKIDSGAADANHSLGNLAHLYGRAALVITNRLHSVIFSVLASRPVLAIDDGTGKVLDMAQKFNLPTLSTRLTYTNEQVTAIMRAALNIDSAEWSRRKSVLQGQAFANLT